MAVALGITSVGFLGAYIASSPEAILPVVAAPVAPPVVELTQEALDAKMETVVFFLGRGQPEGATQIITDTVKGTNCVIADGGWGAFSTRALAEEADIKWRNGARAVLGPAPAILLSGAVTRAENPKLAGGKWIGASVAVSCA